MTAADVQKVYDANSEFANYVVHTGFIMEKIRFAHFNLSAGVYMRTDFLFNRIRGTNVFWVDLSRSPEYMKDVVEAINQMVVFEVRKALPDISIMGGVKNELLGSGTIHDCSKTFG